MAQLIIFREKSMMGMAAPMDCYVNGKVVCKVKNGEKVACEVGNVVIGFKCNMYSNPMSDVVYLDMTDGKTVNIKIKQGAFKPSVTVVDKSAITTQIPNTTRAAASVTLRANPQGDLRTALRTMQKSMDVGDSNNAVTTVDGCSFTPTREVGNYFAIDENTRLWAIGKGMFPSLKKAVPYSYDDIVDFELLEDGSSIIKGGVGSSIVGAALFGGIGAVVGSATGKKKIKQTCTNLMVKITVNNMGSPVEYIKLISSTTSKNSMIYRGAYRDAQEIISLLQLICNQRNSMNNISQKSTHCASAADEIRKYKALMDEGIITEEEFLSKKKQLLDLK